VVVVAALGVGSAAAADQVDDLARTLMMGGSDASEKARIAAVVSLGRLNDARSLPALVRALDDRSPLVRGVAASALGHLLVVRGDLRALPPLEKAINDENATVRARASDALARMRSGPAREPVTTSAPLPARARFVPREAPRRSMVQVAVNRMGGKTSASGHLTGRMHDLLVRQLADAPGVSISEGARGAALVVDGSITRLSRETRGPFVEITCEVRLTVSNASGSLLSIVSGGATVQASRGSFKTQIEPNLQAEALDNAVMGVHPKLIGFLARHTQ
jgi:hypothetical protein